MPRKTPATLKAEQDAALWRGRAHDIKAEYDVLKSNKLRRTPKIETSGEGGIYTSRKRLYGTNIGRDLERNYSSARGIINQFRANVVGSLGKLQVNADGGKDAAAWFNGEWSKECDFRDDLHWSTFLQNVVACAIREGDMLAVFDDGLIEDSGKLITWESDQIVPLTDDALTAAGYPGMVQDNGIIRDKWGRVVAYVTTGKRGLTTINDAGDATIWKRDQAIMPRSPWRLNQGRGVPAMLTASASFLDLYEMLARELQTAKRAAAQYAFVNRKDAVDDWDNPGGTPERLPENDGKTAATTAAEGANSSTSPDARNYENLEALTGGYMDYGDPGDEVNWPPSDRPNVHMAEFIESVLCQAGAAFGLARAYSMLRADTSYTAFRGDMILSWHGAFYPMQKWVERSIADWVGVRALRWAMRKKLIPALRPGWEKTLSWSWPIMPEVDRLQAENATATALKNGTTDYAHLLGPDWESRLESMAEQIEVIRKLGLPLSVLEMKSGGVSEQNKGNEK
jgi:capsid protein